MDILFFLLMYLFAMALVYIFSKEKLEKKYIVQSINILIYCSLLLLEILSIITIKQLLPITLIISAGQLIIFSKNRNKNKIRYIIELTFASALIIYSLVSLYTDSKIEYFKFKEGDAFEFCHIEITEKEFIEFGGDDVVHYINIIEYDLERVTMIESTREMVFLSHEENGVTNTERYIYYNTNIECHNDQ